MQEEFEDTRDNQNPYIEEEQTTQWPKETVQKDKQRSIENHNFRLCAVNFKTPTFTIFPSLI
jgi:hypothetical protein